MPTVAINSPKTPVTQGSSGIAAATIPNICKMPGPPAPFIPTPLPNIGNSGDSPQNYSVTVTIEGQPVAIRGSTFGSKGDVASQGSGGGIVSSTTEGRTKFIGPGSLDVQIEGKNVQLLGDPMLNNCGPGGSPANAATLGGLMQAPLDVKPELALLCEIICACDKTPVPSSSGETDLKEFCVKQALIALDDAAKGKSPMKPEIPYNMTTTPPTPITSRELQSQGVLRATQYLPRRMVELGLKAAAQNGGIYQVRIPDVVITRTSGTIDGSSLTGSNLKAVVEIKFNNQPRDERQIADYRTIAGGDPDRVVELSPKECGCNPPDGKPIPIPIPIPIPVPEPKKEPSWFERQKEAIATATGLTGTALLIYLIISEGSRLFPPRNLVPVP
jgi:hypothetical protein